MKGSDLMSFETLWENEVEYPVRKEEESRGQRSEVSTITSASMLDAGH